MMARTPFEDSIDWGPPKGMPRRPHRGLGFDPHDPDSYPYQVTFFEDQEPFGWKTMEPESVTLGRAPDLDIMELLAEFSSWDDDGPSEYRTLEMALRLFRKCCTEGEFRNAFNPQYCGISHADIFAACLDTAMIWERG